MMRYVLLFLIGMTTVMSGCTRNMQPNTPAEQEAQEEMMRKVLKGSSPRAMNEHPKVTDEFKKTFSTGGRGTSSHDQNQSSQDVPLTKQSEDDEESWW